MIIELVYLFAGLIFMAVCWWVAKRVVNRPIRLFERDTRFIDRYLFSPASFTEATSGVVGSTISFYITIFTTFCLSFGWGSILVCVLIPSIAISFLFFYLLAARAIRERFVYPDAMRRRTAEDAVTFMDYLLQRHGSHFGAWFCVGLMGLYIVSIVATEMHSLQILYTHLAKSPDEILVAPTPVIDETGYKFGLAILLCSLGYVIRGGYPGIMRIDRIQVALISLTSFVVLVGITFQMNPLSLVYRQFVFKQHPGDIVSVAVAAFLLIVTWIVAALDNWLRVAGSMTDRVKEANWGRTAGQTEARAIRSLRRLLIASTVLAMLISTVPALLGLMLREKAIGIWEAAPDRVVFCANVPSPKALATPPNSTFLDTYISRHPVLTPLGCGDWMAPDTRDPAKLDSFNRFTSSMYDLFSLYLADRWIENAVQSDISWGPFAWLFVSGVLAVSVICAVITTVNSYLLCTSQLVRRIFFLDPDRPVSPGDDDGERDASRAATRWGRVRDRLIQPLPTTLLVSLVIAYLVQSTSLTEANYISYGILAFCNIVYLAVIAAISVLDRNASRIRRSMYWLATTWVLVIIFWVAHMFAERGALYAPLQESVIGRQLAPRTAVVEFAGFASLLVCLVNYAILPVAKWVADRGRGGG